jgi:4-hydroxy-3-methylbut-2-enyl diphosphate reductase
VNSLAESVDALIVVGGRESGNTQRLVEVAWEAGKTVFHVEDESELDMDQLKDIETIGITAGASTPNWVINRVFKKLETHSIEARKSWRRVLMRIQRTLLLTNLYVALGAGCLTYACTTLLGIEKALPHILIAFLYVLSMHTFNNLIGKKSDHYNDPDRALFYDKHMITLAAIGLLSGAAGLAIAITMGTAPFLFLLVVSIMGLFYNIPLVPRSFSAFRYRRISDMPGSKSILIVVAWGIVTSVFPALSVTGQMTFNTFLVFLWAVGVVFVRTTYFDILDMQGDRVVGTKTIPILAGERRTKLLLKYILIFLFSLLLVSSAFGVMPPLGFALCTIPVIMSLIILAHERGIALPGFRPVFWMETNFILIGMITLAYGV